MTEEEKKIYGPEVLELAKEKAREFVDNFRHDGVYDHDLLFEQMLTKDCVCLLATGPTDLNVYLCIGLLFNLTLEMDYDEVKKLPGTRHPSSSGDALTQIGVYARNVLSYDDPAPPTDCVPTILAQIDANPSVKIELDERGLGGLTAIDVVLYGMDWRKDTDKFQEEIDDLAPWACLWDFYMAAYYESTFAGIETEDRHEFAKDRSYLEAFGNNFGTLVHMVGLRVAVPRPKALVNQEAEPQLHGETEAALVFADGTEVYCWNGVRVPEKLILDPESFSGADVLRIRNQELRRCHIEKIGWAHICKDLGLELIDTGEFEFYGHKGCIKEKVKLFKLPANILNDDEDKDAVFVEVICPSTGRKYLNRVDPGYTDAKLAVAEGRFDMTVDEFEDTIHS